MKRIAVLLCVVMCLGLLVSCGAAQCTVEGCEGEAVEDAVFEKQFCADHLAKKYCAIESCDEVAVEDTAYEEGYCKKHLANKKAYDVSKMAYENITKAYKITEQYGDDIYDAWYIGIFNTEDLYDQGGTYLASELNLTEEELAQGVSYALIQAFGMNWDETDQATKEEYMEASGIHFLTVGLMADIKTFCVECVNGAYEVTGKNDEALLALEEAKTLMKQLSEEYADYEHYPNLKGYYTATSSFFNFCVNPTGSFDQLRTTINDYRNEARDYISDLDYIFEE